MMSNLKKVLAVATLMLSLSCSVDKKRDKPQEVASKTNQSSSTTPTYSIDTDIPILGSTDKDCEFIKSFDQKTGQTRWMCILVDTVFERLCPIRTEDIPDITAACNSEPTLARKIKCVADRVRAYIESIDPGGHPSHPGGRQYVCRHYAGCMEEILGSMGIPSTFAAGMNEEGGGHAWNTCPVEGGKLVFDALNGIYIYQPN